MSQRPLHTLPVRPLALIVDGHDDTRALYSLALSAMGFDVVPARDGEDGYERAWVTHPDIIVTEVSHEGSDDWSFVQHLKDDARTRSIPVVVLTGFSQPSVRERAAREGCAAFIVKPCLPEQLAYGLRQVLESRTGSVRDGLKAVPYIWR